MDIKLLPLRSRIEHILGGDAHDRQQQREPMAANTLLCRRTLHSAQLVCLCRNGSTYRAWLLHPSHNHTD